MFYAALALLQKIGKIPSKHISVISLFDTEFVLPGLFSKELSRNFHKAFELRQVSDYRILERLTPAKAGETLAKAKKFVEAVEAFLET
jgi:uncharacterized protein